MHKITIELAKTIDLEEILRVYQCARKYMKENGNATQWGDAYPPKEMLVHDIEVKYLYVIKEEDKIHGVFAFILGEDPTYKKIYEGKWLSDSTYGTIHRIASDGIIRGSLKLAIEFALTKINHLRIDTHENNIKMNDNLIKYNFKKVGKIICDDGTSRVAYEYLSLI